MSQSITADPVCRSVFQQGAPTTTTEKYTQAWITLINRIEKDQEALAKLR